MYNNDFKNNTLYDNDSFEKFMEMEKKNSTLFFNFFNNTQHYLLTNDRFDDNIYILLESIWKNKKLINEIYKVIDDILKSMSREIEPPFRGDLSILRYLIIGDFIFSLFSFDLKDPTELIFKTTRANYINRIKVRAAIADTIFGCWWSHYITIHQKLLIGLTQKKVLKKTTVRTSSKQKKIWNTIVYFEFEIKEEFLEQKNLLGMSKFPFVIVKIFGIDYSVGTFRNIWDVKRKKRTMENIQISKEGVEAANNISYIISSDLFYINKEIILKEQNKILQKVNCISLDDYWIKLKKILKEESYCREFLSKNEKDINIEDNDLTKNEKSGNITNEEMLLLYKYIKEEHNNLLSQFQKILSFQICNKEIFDQKFYMPCFMDNRGRQYYYTAISPTFKKLFRHLFKFGVEKNFKNLTESTYYNKIIKYRYLIINLITEHDLNEKLTYITLVLLIEIGKFFIKNSGQAIVKTEEIINLGLENFKSQNKSSDFEDALYLQKIYFSLNKLLIEKKIDDNEIIFKDATSSGLQNFGLLFGFKKDKLKFLNIDGDDWCDTYQYLINKFSNFENFPLFKLNKRTYFKRTIMTIPYNAVWYSCFKSFVEALRKNNIEYNNLTDMEKETLIKIHRDFYNNLKTNIKNEFYENKKAIFIEFKYYKFIDVSTKEVKVNYKTWRDKYIVKIMMQEHDSEATAKACEANNMHYLDAELIRCLIKHFEILTVHDCIGVRLCELHLVMDFINDYYAKRIGLPTYGTHLFI